MNEQVRCPYCRAVVTEDGWRDHTRHHSTWLIVRTSWRVIPAFTALTLLFAAGVFALAVTAAWLVWRP